MIRSMTGFAEKRFDSKTLSAKISIKSLNHRFLDWNCKGVHIRELENRFRAICQKKLYRGRIEVFVDLSFMDSAGWEISVNEDLLSNILSSLAKVSSKVQEGFSFSVENLFNIPQVIELKRKSFTLEEKTFLEKGFTKALDELIKVKTREGQELKKAVQSHVRKIKRIVINIQKLATKQPRLIKERLKARLQEISAEVPFSEEKLIEEAAYLAQRYDLAEEITRLKCHLEYVQKLLSSPEEEPVGRKLDFLAQELYREANTINSKAQDFNIVKESLAIKGEVESIRQQVQNIE